MNLKNPYTTLMACIKEVFNSSQVEISIGTPMNLAPRLSTGDGEMEVQLALMPYSRVHDLQNGRLTMRPPSMRTTYGEVYSSASIAGQAIRKAFSIDNTN